MNSARSYRLLIVDDNAAIHADFRKILGPDSSFDTIEVPQLAHALTEKWTLLQSSRNNLQEVELIVSQRTHELQASEQRSRKLSAQAPIGISEIDAAGPITYSNPWWTDSMRLSPSKTLLDSWRRSIDPDDAASVFALWRNVVSEDGESPGCFET